MSRRWAPLEHSAARLRITLMDLDAAPWREIEIPLSMPFKGLHDAIQAAFLWFDMHLWEFEVDGRRYGLPFFVCRRLLTG